MTNHIDLSREPLTREEAVVLVSPEASPERREAFQRLQAKLRRALDAEPERCPTCGTDDRTDRFAMLDRGRAFDAGISGCPDPFHEPEQRNLTDVCAVGDHSACCSAGCDCPCHETEPEQPSYKVGAVPPSGHSPEQRCGGSGRTMRWNPSLSKPCPGCSSPDCPNRSRRPDGKPSEISDEDVERYRMQAGDATFAGPIDPVQPPDSIRGLEAPEKAVDALAPMLIDELGSDLPMMSDASFRDLAYAVLDVVVPLIRQAERERIREMFGDFSTELEDIASHLEAPLSEVGEAPDALRRIASELATLEQEGERG